jgi:hypothetical protein
MRTIAASILAGSLLAGCGTSAIKSSPQPAQDLSRFSYTRLYCTPDNESHFDTVTMDLDRADTAPPAPPFFAKINPATRMVIVSFEPRWGADDLQARKFHPAPAAQFVVYLQGTMSITVTSGETRRFGPGDVLRVEDTAPCKGHISVAGDAPSITMLTR